MDTTQSFFKVATRVTNYMHRSNTFPSMKCLDSEFLWNMLHKHSLIVLLKPVRPRRDQVSLMVPDMAFESELLS
jgi:hypothetical protein